MTSTLPSTSLHISCLASPVGGSTVRWSIADQQTGTHVVHKDGEEDFEFLSPTDWRFAFLAMACLRPTTATQRQVLHSQVSSAMRARHHKRSQGRMTATCPSYSVAAFYREVLNSFLSQSPEGRHAQKVLSGSLPDNCPFQSTSSCHPSLHHSSEGPATRSFTAPRLTMSRVISDRACLSLL